MGRMEGDCLVLDLGGKLRPQGKLFQDRKQLRVVKARRNQVRAVVLGTLPGEQRGQVPRRTGHDEIVIVRL